MGGNKTYVAANLSLISCLNVLVDGKLRALLYITPNKPSVQQLLPTTTLWLTLSFRHAYLEIIWGQDRILFVSKVCLLFINRAQSKRAYHLTSSFNAATIGIVICQSLPMGTTHSMSRHFASLRNITFRIWHLIFSMFCCCIFVVLCIAYFFP